MVKDVNGDPVNAGNTGSARLRRGGSHRVRSAGRAKIRYGTGATGSVRKLETQQAVIRAKASAVVEMAGSRAKVASILGVARTQPGQWISGREAPSTDSWQHLADLEYVMSRVALVWHPEMVMDWMGAPNAFLDGARPFDVLKLYGPGDVIAAINAESAGSYA